MNSAEQTPRTGAGWARRLGLGLTALLAPTLALTVGCNALHLHAPRDKGEAGQDKAAHPALPARPSKHAFRVAPYVFLSDFPVAKDQPLFKELAQLRDQVCKELLLPAGTAEVRVHLFETRARYERFMQAHYPELPVRRAFFVAQQRALGAPEELLVYTYWGDRIRQDLRHELTHALLHGLIRDVPIWLDEGLAEYFELPPEARGVNGPYVEQLRRALADGSCKPDLARLEALRQVDQMNRGEYREAWAWVHLMLHSGPAARTALLSYLQQLRGHRQPGPLRPQLEKVFPSPEEAFTKHLASKVLDPPAEP